MLDIEWVRGNFPAFRSAELADWVFLENAGGSYACSQVIDRLHRYYTVNKVQPDYAYPASIDAQALMDEAHERMAGWLGVPADSLHFGPSTSANTYVLSRAFAEMFEPGDEIIVTELDHEANIGAWRRLADRGVEVREWRIDRDSESLDPAGLDALLNERTRLVAFSHCSNIVGTINPVRQICDRIREAGAVSVVDGVSYCPHGMPDLSTLGADIYLFSLYKVYGPHQGVLYVREDLAQRLPNQSHFFHEPKPHRRLVPSGPDHAQVAAVNGVVDYMEALWAHQGGHENGSAAGVADLFEAQEKALMTPLLDWLNNRAGVRLIGRRDAAGRAPTISISVDGRKPADLAAELAEHRIAVGFGHFYAYRLMDALGIDPADGVLRLSMVHYNTGEDVERTIAALDAVI